MKYKHLFLTLLMFFTMLGTSVAQNIQWYKTTAFASQTYNYYTQSWNDWTSWEKSSMNLNFDLSSDVMGIYSPQIQGYTVFNVGNAYTDTSGGHQVKFNARNGNGDRVDIRLRIEKNGNSQIYVDYADMRWVYNVVRTQ